jgi:hexulose-6-phosphate isomerase
MPDRRHFLKSTAALAALAALRPALSLAAGAPRLAIPFSRLPGGRSVLERFQLASAAGFSGIVMPAVYGANRSDDVREAARRSGLGVQSVVDEASRDHPLSSADAAVVRQGVAGVTAALRTARVLGAGAVMITPASAAADLSYKDAWQRSQMVIREQILPVARDLGVVITIEEVRGGFVPAPSELARYVDAFASPSVKASFHLGRIAFFTNPQDWIRALGPRLVQVRANGIEARHALTAIGYDGWVIAY